MNFEGLTRQLGNNKVMKRITLFSILMCAVSCGSVSAAITIVEGPTTDLPPGVEMLFPWRVVNVTPAGLVSGMLIPNVGSGLVPTGHQDEANIGDSSLSGSALCGGASVRGEVGLWYVQASVDLRSAPDVANGYSTAQGLAHFSIDSSQLLLRWEFDRLSDSHGTLMHYYLLLQDAETLENLWQHGWPMDPNEGAAVLNVIPDRVYRLLWCVDVGVADVPGDYVGATLTVHLDEIGDGCIPPEAELLHPLYVGLKYVYNRTDGEGSADWTVEREFVEKMTANSKDYYQLRSWNYDNDGQYEIGGFVRSTQNAVYSYNPSGDDLQFQAAPVGTMWTFYEEHGSGLNYKVIEIVAIEELTVPYGTFCAYKHRKYRHNDSGDYSPYWYEWIVPGVGMVKEEDYWTDNPPAIMELVSVTSVPEAALDIDMIHIETECEHVDGSLKGAYPWDFEIKVSVSARGLLHHIDVIKPGDTTSSHTFFEEEPDLWAFDPPKDSSLEALRLNYPEGTYTLEFRDSGNTLLKTVSLDYSGLSAPASVVDFTYPSVNGQTGVSANPTFEWTIEADAGDVLALGVDDAAGEPVYAALPVSMTTLSWSPGLLLPSHEYELNVSVNRVKDWVGPGMPTMIVGGDEFAYILVFCYHNEITFTISPNCDFCGPPGSVEPDGYVDYWDLLHFAQRWHTRLGDPDWDPRCDLDKEDDYVDYWDLLVFAQQWHKGVKP